MFSTAPPVRSAEKSRTATCEFSNEVASVSISKWRELCRVQGIHVKQTVLATFVLRIENTSGVKLQVVALGVGTKFLNVSAIKKDVEGKRVRDMHAEILARRGFLRFLYQQLHLCARGEETMMFSFDKSIGLCTLKRGVTIHFYTSSQPCGNACLKKFAHPKPRLVFNEQNKFTCPKMKHGEKQFTAIRGGEIALLLKGSDAKLSSVLLQPTAIPPGTRVVSNPEDGGIHTCSDKILRWNVLGVQGSLICHFLSCPLYLDSCTIGRKYARVFCERALCCRANGFSKNSNHPTMLCTSVKLDDTVYEDKGGATFEDVCIVWTIGDDLVHTIDGVSGLEGANAGKRQGSLQASVISKRRIAQLFEQVLSVWPVQLPSLASEGSQIQYDKLKTVGHASKHWSSKKRFLEGAWIAGKEQKQPILFGSWAQNAKCSSLFVSILWNQSKTDPEMAHSCCVPDQLYTRTVEQPSSFQKRVYEAAFKVPRGKVTTYGAIAKYIGSVPRPVGGALRNNKWAPEIPCHRIVAGDFRIGGFCGSWGASTPDVKRKRNMLEKEGVVFDDKNGKVLPHCIYQFVSTEHKRKRK